MPHDRDIGSAPIRPLRGDPLPGSLRLGEIEVGGRYMFVSMDSTSLIEIVSIDADDRFTYRVHRQYRSPALKDGMRTERRSQCDTSVAAYQPSGKWNPTNHLRRLTDGESDRFPGEES